MRKLIFILLILNCTTSFSKNEVLKTRGRFLSSFSSTIDKLQIQEGEYEKISGPDDCSEGIVKWIDDDPPVLMVGTNLSFPLVPKGSLANEEDKSCNSSYEVDVKEKMITKITSDDCNKKFGTRRYQLNVNGTKITYQVFLKLEKESEKLLATCVLKKAK